MRKLLSGITMVLCLTIQSGFSEAIITAQDNAVNSDVVLESLVKEIKSAPSDTVDMIGDGIKFVADEVADMTAGAKAIFKSNPVEKENTAGMIEVANAWDSANDIIFRSYKVTDEVGQELMQGAEAAPGTTVNVEGFFNGIEFPRRTSAYFRPEFNRLFIRNTLANILSIEDVLAEQHSAVRDLMGKQVSVETKFVEVNQSTLSELGFDWDFLSKYGGSANVAGDLTFPPQNLLTEALRTAGSIAGGKMAAFDVALPNSDTLVLAKELGSLRWELTIHALEQSDNADVLSAPSIVTRDGNTATIRVGEERMVSLGFDVKNSESSLYIEHDLDPQLMGVSLEVTPEIRSDDLIDLELKPKIIELIGYDNYRAHPDASMLLISGANAATFDDDAVTDPWGMLFPDFFAGIFGGKNYGGIEVPALDSRIPYYRLREIETQVTVADGSTVGMGGLIYDKLETFKDKVPVLGSIPLLGRLFRSEGEKSVKRNLLIFVTATQVDVNGRKASDLALRK